MNTVFIAILALAVPPAQLDTSATPTTRLFVRTVPVGATVTVDGKPIGKSDGLFVVLPGATRSPSSWTATPRRHARSRFTRAGSQGSVSSFRHRPKAILAGRPSRTPRRHSPEKLPRR